MNYKSDHPNSINISPDKRRYYTYLMISRLESDQVKKCKIGHTCHIGLRKSAIESASGHTLRVAHIIPCKDQREARALETSLQNMFRQQMIKGEWFWLSQSDVDFISKIESPAHMIEIWNVLSDQIFAERFGRVSA